MSTTPGQLPAEGTKGLEELWLLGQPTLARLLEFVQDSVAGGEAMDCRALSADWRAANEYCQYLERTEAGIALEGRHRALDPALEGLAAEVRAHPHFRRNFDTLPTEFRLVELDRLIVDQMHVTYSHVTAVAARLGTGPDPRTVFGLCFPLDTPAPPVQVQRLGSHRWVLRCPSTDLRFHEARLFSPAQLAGYEAYGAVAGIVGLVVGFGCNFLTAVRVGRRHLLVNGYHRAVALRALGLTHAPCIVQTATCADELQIAARSRVAERAEFYFESARPPLLRDFFDPKLRRLLPLRPRTRHIELSFEVHDHLVSD